MLAVVITIISLSIPLYGQTDIGFKGAGVRLGFVMPEDPIDNTLGLGLNVHLGTIIPALELFGYVDYWSKSYESSVGIGTTADVSFSVLGIGGIVKYMFELEGNITPFVGGGLGLNIGTSSYEVTTAGQTKDSSDSETDLGIHLLIGAKMPLTPQMDGFGEVKYTIDGVDNLGFWVGINYKLE
jgi:opacity protein-like surface antigen